MRLRRYEAATVSEALARVRAELGPDAVILHARASETDPAGKGVRERVEVMAALDEEPRRGHPPGNPWDAEADPMEPHAEHRPVGPAEAGGRLDATAGRETHVGHAMELGREEHPPSERIEEMVRLLREVRDAAAAPPRLSAVMRPLYSELCEREMPEALTRRLLRDLPKAVGRRASASRTLLQSVLGRTFRVRRVTGPHRGQRLMAMIGPTGVGKTTTIAKLAGQCRQADGLRVALMSLDTYRIGALAQMQIYAELLRAPLHVVRSPDELVVALRAERDADLILLDTMGRSPNRQEEIRALAPFLERIPQGEVHLVLSATTKASDVEEALRRFQPLKYQHVVITKLDEARSAGPILGVALQRHLSISYLTTGQEVPDDLERATPKRLVSFLLPDPGRHRSRSCARA